MTIAEVTAVEGEGPQDWTDRYGDYSHMSLDPNGYTFWFTGEYIASNGNPRSRVFSFEISDANSVDEVNPYYRDVETNLIQNQDQLAVQVSGLYTNEKLTLDIFDMQGKLIEHRDVSPQNQAFFEEFNLAKLASSNYMVRFGNEHFQVVEKFNLSK